MIETHIPAELVEELRAAQQIVVLTGAGTSAESGVPTFRDAQIGLWAQYDPTELATLEAFRRNPRLVWEWYCWRRELVAKAKPNAAHFALAQMQTYVPKLTVITQNIDGLHQQAGSQQVLELHGSLARTKCVDNGHIVDNWPSSDDPPPHCPQCDGYLRPDVVWFGELLPEKTLLEAITQVSQSDLIFSIGTSSLVQPAASLPYEGLQRGVKVVEINPNRTPLTPYVHFALYGRAGQILPTLVDLTWS